MAEFRYQGIAYTSWWNGDFTKLESKKSLDEVQDLGANSVSITSTYFVEDRHGTTIIEDPERTESLENTAIAILDAKARGMTVFLKPHLDSYDGTWRGSFEPSDVDAFFSNYKDFMVEQAKLAQATGVDILSLGVEMDQLATREYNSYWLEIVAAVRAEYDGQITYSAHWYDPKSVSFWDAVDIIGINPYIPLGNVDDSVEDFAAAWETVPTSGRILDYYGETSPVDYFASIAELYGKDIIFTELGYLSTELGPEFPGYDDPLGTLDMEVQAKLYEAFFQYWTMESAPDWMQGAFLWNWYPFTDVDQINNWQTDLTPQGKPAEDVIAVYYGADGQVSAEFVQEVAITIRAAAMSYQGAPELTLVVNGLLVGSAEVSAQLFGQDWSWQGNWETISISAKIASSEDLTIQVYYDNDLGSGGDRNAFVDWIEVDGVRYEAEDAANTANLNWTDPSMAPMIANGVLTFDAIPAPQDSTRPPTTDNDDIAPPRIGFLSTGGLTNAADQTLSGIAEPGAKIQIRAGNDVLGHTVADSIGAWFVSIMLPVEGDTSIVAQAENAAGNVGVSSAIVYTLDTTSPDIFLEVATSGAGGSVTLSGHVYGAGASVDVTFVSNGDVIGSTVTDARGQFSTSIDLGDGHYDIYARASDAAGNQGASTGQSVVISTSVHEVLGIDVFAASDGQVQVSVEATGDVAQLVLQLIGPNGDVIAEANNNNPANKTLHALGMAAPEMQDGEYRVSVMALDSAGVGTSEYIHLEIEKHVAGSEMRVTSAEQISRQFFDAKGILTGSEVVIQEDQKLFRVFHDDKGTEQYIEILSLHDGELLRQYFDPDWNNIGNETVELSSKGTIRHFFDGDWERSGAEIVKFNGAEFSSDFYDSAWEMVGSEILSTKRNKLTSEYYEADGGFTGARIFYAISGGNTQRDFFDNAWKRAGSERTEGGAGSGTLVYLDSRRKPTDEAPNAASDFLATIDPLYGVRGDDGYEWMATSLADLELLAISLGDIGENDSLLDSYSYFLSV